MKGESNSEPGGTLLTPQVELLSPTGRDIRNGGEQVTATLGDFAIAGQTADDNSGDHAYARLEVEIKETNIYIIEAENTTIGPSSPGTYTIQITILGKHGHTLPPQGTTQSKSEGDTDLRSNLATTGFVRPSGDPATGNIETNSDVDIFRILFISGQRYLIDVNGAEITDQGGTLGNLLLTILDGDGNLITNTNDIAPVNFNLISFLSDSDSGAGDNPKIVVDVFKTGNYYLSVEEHGKDATGTYTIQVTALGKTP